MTIRYSALMETPLGPYRLEATDRGLSRLERSLRGRGEIIPEAEENPRRLADALRQIGEYFSGRRRQFDLALDPPGTPFQRRVWAELMKIPYGETVSYGEVARRLKSPNASRAVGMANGRNPLPIVIPCHRVIAADGGLGGYTGGLDIKTFLLRHEQAHR